VTEGVDYARGDELLRRVLSGGEPESGVANELLQELSRGYPVEKLSVLLHSNNERLVETGVWIASELGAGAGPIIRDLLPLYDYPNRRVKYYAVELALTAATGQDGEVIARALSLILDPDRPVRRISFELLARAESARLAVSLPYIDDPEVVTLLEWALEVEGESRENEEIVSRLQGPDRLGALFATVAAARIYGRNPHYLQLAASSGDGDAQWLAASELARRAKLDEQSKRRQDRAERKDG
jgi:hypothetical protein